VVTRHCFVALRNLHPDQFKLVIDCTVWALKHTRADIADIGLLTLLHLLETVNNDPVVLNPFYLKFMIPLMQDILYVLTDTLHKAGFKYHSRILLNMITAVENGRVSVSLFESTRVGDSVTTSNRVLFREHLVKLLSGAFSNLSEKQVRDFILRLCEINEIEEFRLHLRDFLVQMKEFSAGDNTQLYLEEKEREKALQDKHELSVPGLVPPHDPRHDNSGMMNE